MREIKFRVWNIKQNKFLPSKSILNLHLNHQYDESKLIIQQFTGLHDINEKKIYEGDILNYYYVDEGYYSNGQYYKEEKTIKAVVIWYEEGAFWAEYDYGDEKSKGWIHNKESEVIGNIYENPELIK